MDQFIMDMSDDPLCPSGVCTICNSPIQNVYPSGHTHRHCTTHSHQPHPHDICKQWCASVFKQCEMRDGESCEKLPFRNVEECNKMCIMGATGPKAGEAGIPFPDDGKNGQFSSTAPKQARGRRLEEP